MSVNIGCQSVNSIINGFFKLTSENIKTLRSKDSETKVSDKLRSFTILAGLTAAACVALPVIAALAVALLGTLVSLASALLGIVAVVAVTAAIGGGIAYLVSLVYDKAKDYCGYSKPEFTIDLDETRESLI
jgi:uncharacterized membrane protein